MLALAGKAQVSESHLLHKMRFKSRYPFSSNAQELLRTTPADTSKAAWVKVKWRDQWKSAAPSWLQHYVEDPTDVPGQYLPRKQ